MREIVLDTETTGLDPSDGHRIIEIGCVELINYLPTGRFYHAYINPERDVPSEASAISGLNTDFLKPFPIFAHVVNDFLSFIQDDKLIIHNAPFDLKFLNSELERLKHPPLPPHRATDTLKIARAKFPGSPASLDALCRRFQIDLSARTKHGALIDSELLAKVYLELVGGRQVAFSFQEEKVCEKTDSLSATLSIERQTTYPIRSFPPTSDELEAHQKLLGSLKGNLWKS